MTVGAGAIDAGGDLSDTERAVLGLASPTDVVTLLDGYARTRLGSPIAKVLFRAGRIDAVWGIELGDGREVVIKTHRPPADLDALRAASDAKALLRTAGFPCPEPLSGPDEVETRVLTAETAELEGATPDGHDANHRGLLATGLARHIELLRGRPDLLHRTGPGPSWCHYQAGPWPVPHDPIVDFSATPDGYGWLDDHGRRASDQILTHRDAGNVVVGHADWYAGNAAVAGGELVATFDWELVADTEAVIAGFTAACYAASSTSGRGLSTPEDVAAFLHDYDVARGVPLTGREQRTAAGAAAWILAFNARWELALRTDDDDDDAEEGATLRLVRERQQDYLSLTW